MSNSFVCSLTKVKLYRHHHAVDNGERKYSSSFLTSALDGVSGQLDAPAVLYSGERTPGIHWIGGSVDFRDGLDTEAKGRILYLCRGMNPGHSICSQILYWLVYRSSRLQSQEVLFSIKLVSESEYNEYTPFYNMFIVRQNQPSGTRTQGSASLIPLDTILSYSHPPFSLTTNPTNIHVNAIHTFIDLNLVFCNRQWFFWPAVIFSRRTLRRWN
jgi:hypothetical protein